MAFSFSPKIVTDGLVFALDAANQKSYVSGSNSLTDLTSYGGIYRLFNSPTYSTENGGCLIFNQANSQYATASQNVPTFTPTTPFTLNVAGYITDVAGDSSLGRHSTLLGAGSLAGSYGIGIAKETDGTLYITFGLRPNITVSTSYVVQSGEKFFATLSYFGAINPAQYIYKNGSLVTTLNYRAGTLTTLPFASFMNRAVPGGNIAYASGGLFYASIYNRALSATEVLQNYNALKSRFNLT